MEKNGVRLLMEALPDYLRDQIQARRVGPLVLCMVVYDCQEVARVIAMPVGMAIIDAGLVTFSVV